LYTLYVLDWTLHFLMRFRLLIKKKKKKLPEEISFIVDSACRHMGQVLMK